MEPVQLRTSIEVPEGIHVEGIRFAPGGRFFAAFYKSGWSGALPCIDFYDVEHDKLWHELDDGTRGILDLAFSPDGSRLVAAGFGEGEKRGYITVWEVGTWKKLWELHGEAVVLAVAFSSDGNQVVACDKVLNVVVHSAATGELHPELGAHFDSQQQDIDKMAISPDGRRLAVAFSHDLAVFDLQTRARLWSKPPHATDLSSLAFSPDGSLLATSDQNATIKLWNVENGKRLLLLREAGGYECIGISDDRRTLFAPGLGVRFRFWDCATGASLATFDGHENGLDAAALSPDSRVYVSASSDQTLKIWDLHLSADRNSAPLEPAAAPVAAERSLRSELAEQVAAANKNARRHSQPATFDLLRVKEFAELARIGVRLHPRRGAVPDRAASKLGGTILWPKSEPWPVCEKHGVQFLPVAQLAAADFPEIRYPAGTDLLQVLWCPVKHNTGAPWPRIFWRHAGPVTDPLLEMPNSTQADSSCVVQECSVNPERVLEFPDHSEVYRRLESVLNGLEDQLEVVNYSELSAANGWKVGGWPDWIQDPWYRDCPCCGKQMQLLFTIASREFDGASYVRWLPAEDWDAYHGDDYDVRTTIIEPAGISIVGCGNQYLLVCYDCDPHHVEGVVQF